MQESTPAVLIVEDDSEIRRLVTALMRDAGFNVTEAEDAVRMDAILMHSRPDLVILDLMLPGEGGLSICRRLQTRGDLSILMLTAKSDEIDRVVGLELGADDYLVKPFGPRELLARVRALLRRGRVSPRPLPERRLTFDVFEIDLDTRQLRTENSAVSLTDAEFDLLARFVQRPRRVLTRDELFQSMRGRIPDPLDRAIDMIVSRLRRKLASAGANPDLITTVRNGGYLFTAHVERAS